MNYSIFLSRNDQKRLFAKIGLAGRYLRADAPLSGYPFWMFPVDADEAKRIQAYYGVGEDDYDEVSCTLELQTNTALKLLAAVLEFYPHELKEFVDIGGQPTKTLSVVSGGNLQLIIPNDALMETNRTVYAAQAVNQVTGREEILFTTDASAILAYGRGEEKAKWENSRNEELGRPLPFKEDDITILCRHETELKARGVWMPLTPEEEERLQQWRRRLREKEGD